MHLISCYDLKTQTFAKYFPKVITYCTYVSVQIQFSEKIHFIDSLF